MKSWAHRYQVLQEKTNQRLQAFCGCRRGVQLSEMLTSVQTQSLPPSLRGTLPSTYQLFLGDVCAANQFSHPKIVGIDWNVFEWELETVFGKRTMVPMKFPARSGRLLSGMSNGDLQVRN